MTPRPSLFHKVSITYALALAGTNCVGVDCRAQSTVALDAAAVDNLCSPDEDDALIFAAGLGAIRAILEGA